jgi:hypothetical protein
MRENFDMTRKQHRRKNRQQQPGMSDCLGCGASVVWNAEMFRQVAIEGPFAYVLCQHCRAFFHKLSTPAARDNFENCLADEYLRRLAAQS